MRPLDLLLVLAINLVWAGNNVAVKEGVEAVEPLAAGAVRFAIVFLCCLPWLRWMPGRMGAVLGVGAFQGVLHFGFLNLAYDAADNLAALAFINQVSVPLSLLLAVLFLGERIRLPRTLAIAAALGGVALIGFDPAVLEERTGVLLVIVSAFWYAASAVLLRRLTGVHPFTIYAWLALMTAPTLGVASLALEPGALADVPAQPGVAIAAIAYSALGASLVGHGGVAWLLQRYPVSTVTPLLVPTPVITAFLVTAVYDIAVTWRLVVGGAIVTAAVAVITLRTGAALKPTSVT